MLGSNVCDRLSRRPVSAICDDGLPRRSVGAALLRNTRLPAGLLGALTHPRLNPQSLGLLLVSHVGRGSAIVPLPPKVLRTQYLRKNESAPPRATPKIGKKFWRRPAKNMPHNGVERPARQCHDTRLAICVPDWDGVAYCRASRGRALRLLGAAPPDPPPRFARKSASLSEGGFAPLRAPPGFAKKGG
jgi:hypothetical protein